MTISSSKPRVILEVVLNNINQITKELPEASSFLNSLIPICQIYALNINEDFNVLPDTTPHTAIKMALGAVIDLQQFERQQEQKSGIATNPDIIAKLEIAYSLGEKLASTMVKPSIETPYIDEEEMEM